MLLIESVAIHALLFERPWWVHALLLFVNASTIWFLLAHDRAVGNNPVLVQGDGVLVRYGTLISAHIPWASLRDVSLPSWKDVPEDFAKEFLKLSGTDGPNVLLTCDPAVSAQMPLGIRRIVTVLGLRLDDPQGFVDVVRARVPGAAE